MMTRRGFMRVVAGVVPAFVLGRVGWGATKAVAGVTYFNILRNGAGVPVGHELHLNGRKVPGVVAEADLLTGRVVYREILVDGSDRGWIRLKLGEWRRRYGRLELRRTPEVRYMLNSEVW